MNIRKVKLHEGPMDGCDALVTHSTALVGRHLYVWDGGPDHDRFVYAAALVARMTPEQLAQKDKVDAWILTIGKGTQGPPDAEDWIINLCCYAYNFSVCLK